MSNSNSSPILWYIIAVVIALLADLFLFGLLASLAIDADSTFIGAILGLVDAFVPVVAAWLLSQLNQTLGKVSVVLLLLLQIGLLIYFLVGVPFGESMEIGYTVAQALIYGSAIITGIVMLFKKIFKSNA